MAIDSKLSQAFKPVFLMSPFATTLMKMRCGLELHQIHKAPFATLLAIAHVKNSQPSEVSPSTIWINRN
jgi:hypothetical protein